MAIETEASSSLPVSSLRDGLPASVARTSVSLTSVAFALLQSACTMVASLESLRFALGAGALAAGAAAGKFLDSYHADAIRRPMVALALAGSLLNLLLLWQVRRLRARPAAQWRLRSPSRGRLRAERVQLALSVATLLLLAVEEAIHFHWHAGF